MTRIRMSELTALPLLRIGGFAALHLMLALYLMPGWTYAVVATLMFAALLGHFELKARLRLAGTTFPDIFLLVFYVRYAATPFFAPLFCGDVNIFNQIKFSSCDEIYSLQALTYLFVGQVLFSAITLLFWTRQGADEPTAANEIAVDTECLAMICFIIFMGIAVLPLVYPPLTRLPSVNQVFMPSAYFALAILVTYILASPRYRLLKATAAAVFTVYLLKVISGAVLTPALTAVLVAYLVYYRRSQRTNLKWLAVIGFIFITAYPATLNFRYHDWYQKRYETASVAEKAYAFVVNYFEYNAETIACYWSDETDKKACFESGRLHFLLYRFAHLPHVARAMDVTPEKIPFWGGESYRPLLFALVPRAVYPDKPLENLGGYFATDYWQSYTKGMSMNLPIEAEAYLNFGKIGIVLCPVAIALIFLGIQRLPLGRLPEGDNLKLLLTLPLIFPDGNFSLIFGNAIKYLIVFAVILYAAGWSWNRLRRETAK